MLVILYYIRLDLIVPFLGGSAPLGRPNKVASLHSYTRYYTQNVATYPYGNEKLDYYTLGKPGRCRLRF